MPTTPHDHEPHVLVATRALQRTAHELNRSLEVALSELSVSPAAANALACFDDGDSRRMGQLVKDTAQRPSTLTGVVDCLERRTLITRGTDPDDRRSVRIMLTAEGADLHRRVHDAYAAIAARASAHLGPSEVAQCLGGLDQIEHAARSSRPARVKGVWKTVSPCGRALRFAADDRSRDTARDAADITPRRELRNTFGTVCASAGVPLRTIQHWMGHENIVTTERYASHMPRSKDAALISAAFRVGPAAAEAAPQRGD